MNLSIVGIIIVLLVIIFVVRGWKIGLVKAVFDLLSLFIVGLLTWLFYPSVSKFLITTPLYNGIHNWIILTLKDNPLLNTTIPDFLAELPGALKESIVVSSKQTFDSLIVSTADALTVLTVNIISVIILFVTLLILSFFIRKLGKYINNIVIIGPINMILGAFFGFVQGVFICYVVIMIISYFPTTKTYDFVAEDMEKSYICKVMYNEDVNLLGFKPIYPIVRGE